ncbi:MAG: hypothetical protein IJG85_03250 [Eubacteriaceae bacterium]|nr:hypothetical protein [Eubacteriaceae bacterium]
MAKSKKIAIVVAAIALIAVIGVVGSTLAYFTDNDQKTNTFTMGNVNGTLEEIKNDGSEELVTEEGLTFDNVTPNAELVKRAFMQLGNDSSDAYARVKLTWDTTGMTQEQIDAFNAQLPSFLPVGQGWVEGTDGYYYYQTKLSKGDKTVNVIDKVTIPAEWGNVMANASFKLKVEGDFIQADNFEPTKDASGNIVSWGQVTIEQFQAPQQ